jgi:endonuclease/exonuclease/phosphatase family metal-dependent hydrolase
MSFNIRRDCIKDGSNNWEFRKKAIVEMILQESPDIICFQEVMPHMAKYLVKNLNDYYGHSSVECFTGGELSKSYFIWGEGLLVMFKKTRFSFNSKEVIKLFDGRVVNVRRALVVHLYDKTSNTNIVTVSTHFCHKDKNARRQSFELLEDKFCGSETPIFICGDFNCQLTDANNGIDVFSRFFYHNEIDNLGTINFFGGPCGKTIDFVFSNHRPVGTEVLRAGGTVKFLSDHYPVVNTYEL